VVLDVVDVSFVGTYEVYLKVWLTDFPAVELRQPFIIQVDACYVESYLVNPTLPIQRYSIGEPEY